MGVTAPRPPDTVAAAKARDRAPEAASIAATDDVSDGLARCLRFDESHHLIGE